MSSDKLDSNFEYLHHHHHHHHRHHLDSHRPAPAESTATVPVFPNHQQSQAADNQPNNNSAVVFVFSLREELLLLLRKKNDVVQGRGTVCGCVRGCPVCGSFGYGCCFSRRCRWWWGQNTAKGPVAESIRTGRNSGSSFVVASLFYICGCCCDRVPWGSNIVNVNTGNTRW